MGNELLRGGCFRRQRMTKRHEFRPALNMHDASKVNAKYRMPVQRRGLSLPKQCVSAGGPTPWKDDPCDAKSRGWWRENEPSLCRAVSVASGRPPHLVTMKLAIDSAPSTTLPPKLHLAMLRRDCHGSANKRGTASLAPLPERTCITATRSGDSQTSYRSGFSFLTARYRHAFVPSNLTQCVSVRAWKQLSTKRGHGG